jgi:hypothetical protein
MTEGVVNGSAVGGELATIANGKGNLKVPTLGQLLAYQFKERQHLLFPWFREHESCMVYAATGVGKSLFALSAALAVAGGGEFLGWRTEKRRPGGEGWRVLYIDGEMHIADIQERARLLLAAVPGVDSEAVQSNLRFLARQHQDPEAQFPLITDTDGMEYYRQAIHNDKLDLVILDNFSTLGEVADENAASSFNSIQQFLLQLKVQGVATMLVHHSGKSGGDFRGSSKLAATFETIVRLERLKEAIEHGEAQFRVRWDKVRAGGPKRNVREVVAQLVNGQWDYETEELSRLDEIATLLAEGLFINQKEISDHFGVSPPMAGKYIKKGIKAGLWRDDQIGRWFAKGKRRRTMNQTEPPVRAVADWKDEPLEPEGPEEAAQL